MDNDEKKNNKRKNKTKKPLLNEAKPKELKYHKDMSIRFCQ